MHTVKVTETSISQTVITRTDDTHFESVNFTIALLTVLLVIFSGFMAGKFLSHNFPLLLSILCLVLYCVLFVNDRDYGAQILFQTALLAAISFLMGKSVQKGWGKYKRLIAISSLLVALGTCIPIYVIIMETKSSDYRSGGGASILNRGNIGRSLSTTEKIKLFVAMGSLLILSLDMAVTKYGS